MGKRLDLYLNRGISLKNSPISEIGGYQTVKGVYKTTTQMAAISIFEEYESIEIEAGRQRRKTNKFSNNKYLRKDR